MDIKQAIVNTAKTAKFSGVTINLDLDEQEHLQVTASLKGTIDLPGDSERTVVNVFHLLGLGKPLDNSQAG